MDIKVEFKGAIRKFSLPMNVVLDWEWVVVMSFSNRCIAL